MASPEETITSQESIIFEEQIDPTLLDQESDVYRSARPAIFDLLDNELDAAKPGKPTIINVICESNRLSIIGRGGEGMGKDELKNFFVWGRSSKVGKIGRYSKGAKTAMAYLAQSFRLTCAKEQGDILEIFEPQTIGRKQGLKKYVAKNTGRNRGDAFVKIELTNLRRTISAKGLREEIANTYCEALAKKRIIIYVGDGKDLSKVEPVNIPLATVRQEINLVLPSGVEVNGWIGELTKDRPRLSLVKPGIRAHIFDRLVEDQIFFGFPDPSEDPGMRYLVGVINIDSDRVPVTTEKSAFSHDSPIWENELTPRMRVIMEPYVFRLQEFGETGRAPWGDRPDAQAALKAIKLGLTYFETGVEILPRKKRRVKILSGSVDRKPDSLSPEQLVGKERRKIVIREKLPTVGFSDIKFEDLGADTSSDFLEEADKRVLVINPNYPAYRVAKKKKVLSLQIASLGAFELAKAASKPHRGEIDYADFLTATYDTYLAYIVRAGEKAKIF